jgi:uncharacterized protein YbjT (DUF2867 family)
VRILVVGASGYVGGRLVPLLAARGHELVLATRNPRPLEARFPGARVVRTDLLDPSSLPPAVEGVDLAYYLAHSTGKSETDRAARDSRAAANFAHAAAAAGVGRIVHLGGLGDEPAGPVHHRGMGRRTGAELAVHGVPVTEFRAAVIVGSGSAAFEMVRHLTERLPIMVTPRWVAARCQPVGIRDVLDYLVAAAEHPEVTGVVEIGGPDVLTFGEMMMAYARQRGLQRFIIPVPVRAARLSSYWVSLFSPVPSGVARPLIEGLQEGAIVRDPRAAQAFGLAPVSYGEALGRAIRRTEGHEVETTWFDSYRAHERTTLTTAGNSEGMLVDRRVMDVAASPQAVFTEVARVGGATGWPYGQILWQIRGLADRLVGGVGLRLGRRDPNNLRVGDAIDFWRVEEVQPPELLRLRDAMKLPGRAWLQYEVLPVDEGRSSQLVQTAFFEPHGLPGLAYWYGLMPVHPTIFRGMIAELSARAVAHTAGDGPGSA